MPAAPWKAVEPELGFVLDAGLSKPSVSALFIEGPPCSGFTSDVPFHVAGSGAWEGADVSILYVFATQQELDRSASATIEATSRLGLGIDITTYDLFDRRQQAATRLVLLIDMRPRATVEREIFFGKLLLFVKDCLNLKQNGADVRVVLVFMGWYSPRLASTLLKVMDTRRVCIPFDHIEAKSADSILHGQGPPKTPDELFEMATDAAKGYTLVMGIDRSLYQSGDMFNFTRAAISANDNLSAWPIDKPLIMATQQTHDLVPTRQFAHPVRIVRKLTRCELATHVAWLIKATGTRARFVMDYSLDDMLQQPLATEKTGPAWGRDGRLLVLEIAHNWIGVTLQDLPRLEPVAPKRLQTALRQCLVLGCLVKTANDGLELTTKGQAMRNIMRAMPGLEWSAAWLATSAATQADPVCQSILVLLAALIQSRLASQLFRERPDGSEDSIASLDDVKDYDCCAEAVREYAGEGVLWLALGLLIDILVRKPGHLTFEHGDWLEVRPEFAEEIDHVADTISKSTDVTRRNVSGWATTPLTNEQVDIIDQELAWSHLHQLALPRGSDFLLTDCCSLSPFDTAECSLPTAVYQSKDSLLDQLASTFYLAYRDIVEGTQSGHYVTTDLTVIRTPALLKIAEHTRTIWPSTVLDENTMHHA